MYRRFARIQESRVKRIRNRHKSGHQFDNAPCRIEMTMRDTALQSTLPLRRECIFWSNQSSDHIPQLQSTQKWTNLQQ